MEYSDVKVIKSRRRTMEMRIDDFGAVTLRVPDTAPEEKIRAFFESRKKWAEKHIARLCTQRSEDGFTEDEMRKMTADALLLIPERVRHFAGIMKVKYGRITVRNQVTKWGSCTSGGNLSFNCMLTLMPPGVLDSVIVHELCHIKHMDHSKAFYREIYKVMPDYEARHKWLSDNGSGYMRKMRLYREGKR